MPPLLDFSMLLAVAVATNTYASVGDHALGLLQAWVILEERADVVIRAETIIVALVDMQSLPQRTVVAVCRVMELARIN